MKRMQAHATTFGKHAAAASGGAAGPTGACVETPGPGEVIACPFNKRVQQRCIAPATPATWSRYIDSRLKQFCTR